MNYEGRVKFHNRFDIEVIDVRTGEVRQRAQAENIILDRMYTRITQFATYFTKIHFGNGIGTLDPARTTLFAEIRNAANTQTIGYKDAIADTIVRAFPTSSVTKRIELLPEEFVGANITEVGISETSSTNPASSYVNTHAVLTDAEGHEISILKLQYDLVIIYATVYIELVDTSTRFTWARPPVERNSLIEYLVAGSSYTGYISLGQSPLVQPFGCCLATQFRTTAITAVYNDGAKTRSYTKRIATAECNNPYGIREVALWQMARVVLPETAVFTSKSFTGVVIGTGDGVKTKFAFPNVDVSGLTVKVNDVVTTDLTTKFARADSGYLGLGEIIDFSYDGTILGADAGLLLHGILGTNKASSLYGVSMGTSSSVFKVNVADLTGYKIEAGYSSTGEQPTLRISGSADGVNWTQVHYSAGISSTVRVCTFLTHYPYLKIDTISGNYGYTGYIFRVIPSSAVEVSPCITFDTPPDNGVAITADYTVDYIPKNENYVLDVTFTILFGEGV